MDNKKSVCKSCGTPNEAKYEYCKNCGTPLEKQKEQIHTDPFTGYAQRSDQGGQNTNYSSNNFNQYPPPNYNQNNVYGNTYVETIDGIPYGEVATFIGKNAQSYMPVFSKMEITGAKTAWHWPTALLSFFFGPIVTALWFFYRKMYKFAAILVVIGIITTVASTLIIGPSLENVDLFDIVFELNEEELPNNEQLMDAALKLEIANLISGFIGLACAVICGLFTHNWYKKHIHSSILKYRASNVDMGYYHIGLMSIGGTSGGMLALGFGLILCVENIPALIYMIQSLM